MIIPPAVMKLHIAKPGRKGVRLWLPLFILAWPFLALLILFFAVLWMVAAVFFIWSGKGRKILKVLPAVYQMLCSFRGTDISFRHDGVVQIVLI